MQTYTFKTFFDESFKPSDPIEKSSAISVTVITILSLVYLIVTGA
jgi:hypothetical protein